MIRTNKRVEAIFPLSPQQNGMLFESLFETGSGLHIDQFVCTLEGELYLDLFRLAWRKVLDRHPTLRIAIAWKDQERPLQVALLGVAPPIAFEDWRAFDPAEQRARLADFLHCDRTRPFTLSDPPLLRFALLRVEDSVHDLVWTTHHILMDGWCRPILLNDFLRLYRAAARGEDLPVRTAPSYASYVAWLGRQDVAQAEAFWRQRLRGFTAPTELGVAAPAAFTEGGERYGQWGERLGEEVTASLRALSRRLRLTMNTLVQAAWGLVLSRCSGRGDVVFGATVAGRPPDLPGAEEIVGLFINTLPVRLAVEPRDELGPWLQQLQSRQARARAFEHCSQGQVHGWSEVPSSLPLYESILVFENYPAEMDLVGAAGELRITFRDLGFTGVSTRYALTLLAVEGRELALQMVYDRRRFDEAEAVRAAGHLARILSAWSADPGRTLGEYLALIPGVEIPRVKSLPRRQAGRSGVPVAPRNLTEERLARIWCVILGIERIGVDDNFFELGGHSLLATEILARVRRDFATDLPLRRLFESPTVAGLALEILVAEAGKEDAASLSELLDMVERLPEGDVPDGPSAASPKAETEAPRV